MAHVEGSTVKVVGFVVNGGGEETAERSAVSDVALPSHSPPPVTIPPPFVVRTPREPRPDETKSQRRRSTSDAVVDVAETNANSELTRSIAPTPAQKSPPPPKKKGTPEKKATAKKKEKTVDAAKAAPCVSMFDHLAAFRSFSRSEMLRHEEMQSMHPAFLQFCAEYGERRLSEASACQALLEALNESLELYGNDDGVFYTREYLAFLNRHIGGVAECRALNVAMRNAIRMIKVEATKLQDGISLDEGRSAVRRVLQTLIEERIDVGRFIATEASTLINDNDVIMTYGRSETVFRVLSHAWCIDQKRFRVVLVDGRPGCEAKGVLERLVELGIPCSYLLINAICFVMKDVSKIFLGASAVLSNGTVVGRAGSAAIAMMAQTAHVPTVVCCQTLKFHERVQLDSFTHNELGDAQELVTSSLEGLDPKHPCLSLLNVRYDLMPAAFVSMIVTELGFVPASSVPVILREQASEKELPRI